MTSTSESLGKLASNPVEERAREEVRGNFEQECGEKWWTNPVCHGETAFSSWAYQQWLEDTIYSLRLTNQRLEAEVERMKEELDRYSAGAICVLCGGAEKHFPGCSIIK